MAQCTAKSKATGERCKGQAVTGYTVCRVHGGLTPRGPALPQYKHGRYSKLLPGRLAADYRRAASDPNLLSLREDVALADARLAEVLKGLDAGETGALWGRLQGTWKALLEARATGDGKAMAEAMTRAGDLIDRGGADRDAWGEVVDLLYLRRKLVESERKRMLEMQQLVSNEQMLLFVGVVYDSLRRHVEDRGILAAIVADIGRATGANGPGVAGQLESGD